MRSAFFVGIRVVAVAEVLDNIDALTGTVEKVYAKSTLGGLYGVEGFGGLLDIEGDGGRVKRDGTEGGDGYAQWKLLVGFGVVTCDGDDGDRGRDFAHQATDVVFQLCRINDGVPVCLYVVQGPLVVLQGAM
jgi:hypothetical protein